LEIRSDQKPFIESETTERTKRLTDSITLLLQEFSAVKNLLKVPTWQLEWDSNVLAFGQKANLPMIYYAPKLNPVPDYEKDRLENTTKTQLVMLN